MKLKEATAGQYDAVCLAVVKLREARNLLAQGGAIKAAQRANLALKSAEGAERHAARRARRALDQRALEGCWHYDYDGFCTQCDPASYGACDADCKYIHEHCVCPDPCAVHEDDEEEDDEDDDEE